MSNGREFDIVVYGASGFTGRLVAEYLHQQYGADGDVMEVDLKDGGTEMFTMSREVVPEIDLENGRIVVNPPVEIYADENHDDDPESKEEK